MHEGLASEFSVLRRIPLFAPLTAQDLEQVRQVMTSCELRQGSYLFHQGERGDALHIVLTGVVEAVVDEGLPGEQVVSTFSAGDFLGEIALLTNHPRTASIRARSDARLLTLSQSSFEELLDRYPQLSRLVNRVLSNRLRTTTEYISRKTARLSLVVLLDESDAREALGAVLESLTRQFQADIALVFLGRDPLSGFDGGEDRTYIQAVGAGGHHIHTLTIPSRELEEAADAAIRERVDLLAAGVAHTVLCADPALVLSRPELVAPGAPTLVAYGKTGAETASRLRNELVPTLHGTVHLTPTRAIADSVTRTDRYARILAGISVGLVLSGGAAQGTAHLGVLQALIEAGVPIDLMAATSGGALYGSMVAAGIPIAQAQATVIAHTRRNLLDRADVVVPRFGLIRGKRIEQMLFQTLGDRQFDQLDCPLSVIATDLADGTEVVLNQGLVYQAVRASISIPGVFVPYLLNGRLLVDGALVNPLPVTTARAMGADFVIAVHVPAPGKVNDTRRHIRQQQDRYNLLSTIVRAYAFAGDVLAELSAANADVCIQPSVAHFGWRDYRSAPAIMRAGYEAGQAALARIQHALPLKIAGVAR